MRELRCLLLACIELEKTGCAVQLLLIDALANTSVSQKTPVLNCCVIVVSVFLKPFQAETVH